MAAKTSVLFASAGSSKVVSKKNKQIKDITVDTSSGSMAYNRFEMQVSQTLHMAIELFDSLDYLLVLDYYDDIALFDNEKKPEVVSYYQMKTNEESISISTAISEDWLVKMYVQLEHPEWLVRELGLITNCPLKVTVKINGSDGKNKSQTKTYIAEKTPFSKFNPITIDKIKHDIAQKKGISPGDVDLTKFVHIRTTLSIPKHREIVEQELGDFLHKKYPRITMDVVKTIFGAMLDILTKRQQYELLAENALYNEVREKKGITKCDFSRVIEEAIVISIPPFDEIQRVAGLSDDDKYKASFEYTKIMSDSQSKIESFSNIFIKIRKLCSNYRKNSDECVWQYVNRLCDRLYKDNFIIESIYNRMYICILTICILINEMRRV
ncbi:TPA: dsDNA nuclease domain-containing protein [Clostridium sporogenes]